jgi:hypothetical protein
MLKSREQFPPNGFQFVQPETGWQAPPGSFQVVTKAILAHRLANPALAEKHKWNMDLDSIGNELDLFNTRRCVSHGWWNFITEDPGGPIPKAGASPGQPRSAAAGGVKQIVAGIQTLLDWLGDGGSPVGVEVAVKRAGICVECPLNGKSNWMSYFTKPASEEIRRQLEIKHHLSLTTPQDGSLNVCESCLCPLKLKVWAPLEHILKYTTDETFSKLHPKCWILSERDAKIT